MVLFLCAWLVLPLHRHAGDHEAEPDGHHAHATESCAWVEGGPRVVFGAAHCDEAEHLCPLAHARFVPSGAQAAAPLAPPTPDWVRIQARDGFRIPLLPRVRGPPSLPA